MYLTICRGLDRLSKRVVVVLALCSALGGQSAVGAAAQQNAGDYFRPREQLAYFEIYHLKENVSYRAGVTLEHLLAISPDDYVRIHSENMRAVSDLYRALNGTTFSTSVDCSFGLIDARWAVVLNYKDGAREAVGLGPLSPCVHFLSKKEGLASSAVLRTYLERTFAFMRQKDDLRFIDS